MEHSAEMDKRILVPFILMPVCFWWNSASLIAIFLSLHWNFIITSWIYWNLLNSILDITFTSALRLSISVIILDVCKIYCGNWFFSCWECSYGLKHLYMLVLCGKNNWMVWWLNTFKLDVLVWRNVRDNLYLTF